MAKQNLLGGGYTGKLGATIGQRWKNLYTMRAYTKPANPKTPAQQNNRGFFSSAVGYAQKGQSMNFHSPAFDTTSNTEWAQRMSAAKYNCQNNLSDVANIPVVPQNFSSSPTITGIAIKEIVANTSVKFVLTLGNNPGQKSYSVMIYFAEGAREGEYLLLRGSTSQADETELTCPCDNTAGLGQVAAYALVVSNDDTTAATVTYSARVPLENASKPAFEQTVSITSITSDNAGGFVVAAQMGVYGADLVGQFTSGGVIAMGNYKTKLAVFQAGSEASAASVTALGLSWNISNWNVNSTTGVITFTAHPTNYQDINHYELTEFRLSLNWTNAYNDQTEMSSGSCQAATAATPTYTQPEFALNVQQDTLYVANYWTTDESTQLTFSWDFGNSDFVNAVDSLTRAHSAYAQTRLKTGGALTLVGEESGSFTILPSYDGMDFNFDDAPTAYISGNIGNPTKPEQELTSGSLTASTFEVTTGSGIKIGGYDTTHRWTKVPILSAAGNVDVW